MTLTKYNANGNDFLITHSFKKEDRSALAKRVCDRVSGIGADGFVVLLPSDKHDFEWNFYNCDGSIAAMCGNAARAAALYAYKNSLADRKIQFLTGAGVITAIVTENTVEVQLTEHKIIRKDIWENDLNWFLIDTGVPHITANAELEVFDAVPLANLRKKYDANATIFSVKDASLFVRTFERGVEGETLACGTGMAAAFVRAAYENLVQNSAKIYPKSGDELFMKLENNRLFFKGAVSEVFTTTIQPLG
ncbi:MAG: diaminopimelate epimerase [Helicobacteraceae bacterium]|jgi:diaminopimelate epimerase|nr:diaminopimelate epimerase [Helicobacteraceae bacterium]